MSCSGQAVQEDSVNCLTPNVKVLCSFETSPFTSIHGVTPQKTWIFSNIVVRTQISHPWSPSAVVCHSCFALSSSKSVSVSSSHSSCLSECFLSHLCWPTLLTCTCHSTLSVCCLFRVITSETVNCLHFHYISWTR
jgi:hypothetical protein